MKLTSAQRDRVAGVLLGQAVGDALGVPYEFGSAPLPADGAVMAGGGLGPYRPGEFSDDTQMAVMIARVSASGADLTTQRGLDDVARGFLEWKRDGATDMGMQTRSVLGGTERRVGEGSLSQTMTRIAEEYVREAGPRGGAGNGASMRTGVVGLVALEDRAKTAEAAAKVAALTHAHPLAIDSAVLWSEAVRIAVTEKRLDLRGGLDLIPADRRGQWQAWIDQAEAEQPAFFARNTFTVHTLQAAWSSIHHTRHIEGPDWFMAALQDAIAIGHDTDTVAAVVGALMGAFVGWSGIPTDLTRRVSGWPGVRAIDLIGFAQNTVAKQDDWPTAGSMLSDRRPSGLGVKHPHDPGVILGNELDLARARTLGATAVVSLSRVGAADVAAAQVEPDKHVQVRLIDSDKAEKNPHLEWVLADVARTVKQLRDEGETVLLHCVAAELRTPSVAVAYSRLLGHGPTEDGAIQAAVGNDREDLLWVAARALPVVGVDSARQEGSAR